MDFFVIDNFVILQFRMNYDNGYFIIFIRSVFTKSLDCELWVWWRVKIIEVIISFVIVDFVKIISSQSNLYLRLSLRLKQFIIR